ncbi:MAG: PAS domain S-box protein [Desulfocucumaceae bacterium]
MNDQKKSKKQLIYELQELRDKTLRLTEERFSKAINASPNPMFISTIEDGRFLDVNQRLIEVSGYTREEIIGHTYLELKLWADFEDRAKAVLMLREQGSFADFEVKGRFKSGQLRDGLLSGVALEIDAEQCMLGIFNDISEKKMAERLLRESNERYKHLVKYAPAGILEYSITDMRFTSVNDNVCLHLGYTREELLSMGPQDFFDDDSGACFRKRMQKLLSGDSIPAMSEYKIKGKNGKELWIFTSSRHIFENGIPVAASMVIHDITERKVMEEALRKSEHFLTNIFESIQDRFFVIDKELTIVRVNKKVEQLFFDCLPLAGKKCYSVFHGRDQACPDCPGVITLKTGKVAQSVFSIQDPGASSITWLDHYFYPFIDDKAGEIQGFLVNARDITEKVRTEKEMARLDSLNLIGEIAASIGHEIRNPMTVVRGFLQMLTNKEECAKYKSYYDIMIDELDRANAIITEFLSLARNRQVELKQQSLNEVIGAIQPLLEADAINSKMNIELALGEITHLLINKKDIRQLILNLVRNGFEAMSPGRKSSP